MIEEEYEYLNKAYEKTAKGIEIAKGTADTINLSGIQTILIQNVGRLCERYASDILYDIKNITDTIKENDAGEYLFAIGIRKNGVDGNAFITNRLSQTENEYHLIEDYYRKIFAVKVTKTKDDVTVELKDIASNIRYKN